MELPATGAWFSANMLKTGKKVTFFVAAQLLNFGIDDETGDKLHYKTIQTTMSIGAKCGKYHEIPMSNYSPENPDDLPSIRNKQ